MSGVNHLPLLLFIKTSESNDWTDIAGVIEAPNRKMPSVAEIERAGSPKVIIRHYAFPIFGRLDNGIDRHIHKIRKIIAYRIEFAAQIEISYP